MEQARCSPGSPRDHPECIDRWRGLLQIVQGNKNGHAKQDGSRQYAMRMRDSSSGVHAMAQKSPPRGTTTHSSTEDKSATREFWLTLAGVENSLSAKRKFAAQHPAAHYVDFHHQERKGKSFASTRNCCVPQFASCCSLQTASCPGALR